MWDTNHKKKEPQRMRTVQYEWVLTTAEGVFLSLSAGEEVAVRAGSRIETQSEKGTSVSARRLGREEQMEKGGSFAAWRERNQIKKREGGLCCVRKGVSGPHICFQGGITEKRTQMKGTLLMLGKNSSSKRGKK